MKTKPALGQCLPHESAHLHVAGTAPYVDDLPEIAGLLHAALGDERNLIETWVAGRCLFNRPLIHPTT